jgi:hypothetical protein
MLGGVLFRLGQRSGMSGIIFSVSFATREPPSPNSRITEIKYGTCDW